MSYDLHAWLGEGLIKLQSWSWPTAETYEASLLALREIRPHHAVAEFVPSLDRVVQAFASPLGDGRTLRQIIPTPGRPHEANLPPSERAVIWSDGQLEHGTRPEHYTFPTEAAARAFETTLTAVSGYFQLRFVPGPGFHPIWNVNDLKAKLKDHQFNREDPLPLVELYKQARAAKLFRPEDYIALELDTGRWVKASWQPGEPVATLDPAGLAPVLESRKPSPAARPRLRR